MMYHLTYSTLVLVFVRLGDSFEAVLFDYLTSNSNRGSLPIFI
uniref:Uncharacterized protein n=1 Tax=Arundo donax TaxID=35708 RepID=A0A0A8Z836_ARUDO